MALKVKLIKSSAGASERQLRTLKGLGLSKFGQERVLQDTPAIRGMAFKVQHLVRWEAVSEKATVRQRKKPRKIVERDRVLSKQSKGAKA
jgi:large subunit ribosomal protein L30